MFNISEHSVSLIYLLNHDFSTISIFYLIFDLSIKGECHKHPGLHAPTYGGLFRKLQTWGKYFFKFAKSYLLKLSYYCFIIVQYCIWVIHSPSSLVLLEILTFTKHCFNILDLFRSWTCCCGREPTSTWRIRMGWGPPSSWLQTRTATSPSSSEWSNNEFLQFSYFYFIFIVMDPDPNWSEL